MTNPDLVSRVAEANLDAITCKPWAFVTFTGWQFTVPGLAFPKELEVEIEVEGMIIADIDGDQILAVSSLPLTGAQAIKSLRDALSSPLTHEASDV